MTTRFVKVTQVIRVTTDDDKFTDEFLREFRASFYPFTTIEEHVEHLAQLKARGIADLSAYWKTEFVEGYGHIGEFGISAESDDADVELLHYRESRP